MNIFQKSSFYYENTSLAGPDPLRLRKELDTILAMDKDRLTVNNLLRRTYLRLYASYMKTGKCPLPCKALSSTCFIDPYGTVYPCAVYERALINIRGRRDLASLWSSEKARRISSECEQGACPSCWSPCDAYSAIAGSFLKAMKGCLSCTSSNA